MKASEWEKWLRESAGITPSIFRIWELIADLHSAEDRAEKANEGWLAQAERDAKEIVRLEAEPARLREELADLRAYYDTDMAYLASGGREIEADELNEIRKRIETRKGEKP